MVWARAFIIDSGNNPVFHVSFTDLVTNLTLPFIEPTIARLHVDELDCIDLAVSGEVRKDDIIHRLEQNAALAALIWEREECRQDLFADLTEIAGECCARNALWPSLFGYEKLLFAVFEINIEFIGNDLTLPNDFLNEQMGIIHATHFGTCDWKLIAAMRALNLQASDCCQLLDNFLSHRTWA
jgi:hypothetical protein